MENVHSSMKNTIIECHVPVFSTHSFYESHTFACAQDSQPHFSLAHDVRDVRAAKGTVLTPWLSERPEKNPAELCCVHVERKLERTQLQRVCTEVQKEKIIFMCPNKLHKDFSTREQGRDVEKRVGWGVGEGANFSLECSPMTFLSV